MDIELADGQSFGIFEQVDIRSRVIFTTSYDEYALQAFKVNSIDYLLKPVQKEDLQRSLRKLHDLIAASRRPWRRSRLTLKNCCASCTGETRVSRSTARAFWSSRAKTYCRSRWAASSTSSPTTGLVFSERARTRSFWWITSSTNWPSAPAQFFRINRGLMLTHRAVEQIQPYFGNRLALTLRPAFDKEAIVSREERL